MIHAGRKRRPNGFRVVGLWTLSLFFLFFCSAFSPLSASVSRAGVEGFTLCLDPFPFLHFSQLTFLLLSFLGVDARRPRSSGLSVIVQ